MTRPASTLIDILYPRPDEPQDATASHPAVRAVVDAYRAEADIILAAVRALSEAVQ